LVFKSWKLFLFFALAIMFLQLTPGNLKAEVSNFTYTLSGTEATITGYSGPGGAVVIPSDIDGYTVTAIGSNAFYGLSTNAINSLK
jgi:hypothetical protein